MIVKKIIKYTISKFENLEYSQNFPLRINIMLLFFSILLVFILIRYSYLALLPTELRIKLKNQATKQFEIDLELTNLRADIQDRNGHPLAITVMYPSIFIEARKMPKDINMQKKIAKQINIPLSILVNLSNSNKNFAWLKRKLLPNEIKIIGDLSAWKDFIGIIEEPKRVYPEKELAAHLIGFIGTDNKGLEGIEAIYDEELASKNIKAKVFRDARGKLTITSTNHLTKPLKNKKALKLSIDISIQTFSEQALKKGIIKAKAKAGSVVVNNIKTGEILAIASYPTYDLNNPPNKSPEKRRFRPIMDALELGSVVKPLFIAQALDKKIIKPSDIIFCENGAMSIPGGKIRDSHPHANLTPSEIIKYSSNIGTYKIVQKMGRPLFYETIIRVGLGRFPSTGLPGEWQGRISKPKIWREMRFANMAFGQGIAISALQLTHAMSVITGGGKDKGISVLANENTNYELIGPELSYISEKTSKLVTKMMESVVEENGGTGGLASVAGVNVAGKTGTAQKYSPLTKSYSERTSSFIGVLPSENPLLAITVIIDEPQVRPAYGGTLAGPVFSEIATQSIRYLNSSGQLSLTTSTILNESEIAKENKIIYSKK